MVKDLARGFSGVNEWSVVGVSEGYSIALHYLIYVPKPLPTRTSGCVQLFLRARIVRPCVWSDIAETFLMEFLRVSGKDLDCVLILGVVGIAWIG